MSFCIAVHKIMKTGRKSGWKGVKRPFPYSKPGYSGYGGYGGGLNSWVLLQQLVTRVLKKRDRNETYYFYSKMPVLNLGHM
jgi:hypothetical protein